MTSKRKAELKVMATLVLTRFVKGLLASAGAFAVQFIIENIPFLVSQVPNFVQSPVGVAIVASGLLALDKALRGYRK